MKRLLIPALFVIAIILLVSPIPEGMKPEAHRLIAVTFLMSGLWVTNVIPLAATSLMPLVLFPLLGIMKPDDVSKSYMSDTLFLYVGGMIIALGIERWQLHRRIALHLVNLVGISPKRLVLGFLLATGILSMWISNTACTLLMLPIVLAMLRTMDEAASESGRTEAAAGSFSAADAEHHSRNRDQTAVTRRTDQLAVPLLLAIAYSSSLGGMTTLVGTPTNSSAAGIYRDQMPNAPEISMAAWLLVCGPIGAVYLAVTWFVLTRGLPGSTQSDRLLQLDLREKLRSLGRPGVAEVRMFLVFAFTGLLWICRKPLIVGEWTLLPGWLDACTSLFRSLGPWFPVVPGVSSKGEFLSDATVSMGVAVLLFLLPSGMKDERGQSQPLMDWKTAEKMPWDMILLFGGGFALADAFRQTDLSGWLGQALQEPLRGQSPWLVIAVLTGIMIFLTEFTSNVATVNTVMPTLLAMAEPLGMDPRLIFLPVTLAASCGFMLPIGTPPNAIVFSTGRVSTRQMAVYGLTLNLVGIPILTIGTFLIIRPLLGIP